MRMLSATPALPVLDLSRSIGFYTEKLGFTCRHSERAFAILARDDIEIHLWEANRPDVPGAESHLAGSASCRVRVSGLRELYDEYVASGVVHPNGQLREQWWGDSDFTVLDADHNAIAFCQRTAG